MGILIHDGVEYTDKPKLDKTLSIEGQAADSKAVGDTKISHVDVVDNLESTATDLPLSANMGRELNTKISTKLSFAEIVSVKKITANSTTTYTLDKLPIVMYFYINKGNNALYTLPVLMNTYGRAVADDIQINFTYNKGTKVLTVTCNVACDISIYGLLDS